MIDRFTAKARESINLAVQAAEELGHSICSLDYWRKAAVWPPGCFPRTVLRKRR